MSQPLLEIRNLRTHFFTPDGIVRAVDDVSLEIQPGETLGLVGESGCGKSMTAYSIMRLLPRSARIVGGQILFRRRGQTEPIDLARVDPGGDLIRDIRGNEIAMVFQEPMTSLSPVHTIGDQIGEAIQLHQGVSRAVARERTVEILERVGFAAARQRLDQYPHQLSGGLRQRAMIAMALSCHPSLLIADEPTTALDVTIQAQILELMKDLQQQFHMAILLITHNLGVIAEMASRVAVMYMGKIVESGDTRTIFHRPLHPYTVGLLRSTPRPGVRAEGDLTPIPGSVPDPFAVPSGCAFYPRCRARTRPSCRSPEGIPLREVEPGHFVRCTLYDDARPG
ncbi:MAG: ABC transporter ATP-binding protein [Chloroflexi bacterium]|jgi:oligopeptide/dipeptide ABC transporter ATP-binding protein|nr:ABC transporter ATP-binding protein [Chloroflexota bacterium]HLG52077.1 ABC transporter ATP-binding protein [Chloroflexota bacterium]